MAEFKVDVQKSVAFLHTSNEQVVFEVKKAAPLRLTPLKMKYLDKNLIKSKY